MEIILFDKDYGIYEKDNVLKDGHFVIIFQTFSHCI